MKIGIIGCGLIGQKRSKFLGQHLLTWAADTNLEKALQLASRFQGADATDDWTQVVEAKNVDAIIIATPHNQLAEIALATTKAKKHFLVEKPAARNAKELESVMLATQENKVVAKVGFNHRFHPAFIKAKEIQDSGVLGPMMFIRGRYGHGGRLNYDSEWRASKNISGGGELIDQGIHLIDLSRWFLGEFSEVSGYAPTFFWNIEVEDNAFVALQTKKRQIAWLHAGWTEWKNLFCFEIFGKHGKLQIDGLGGSYGIERLTFYKMHPEMGPPETTAWEYPSPDRSWEREFQEFIQAIEENRLALGNLADAHAALKIVDKIYGIGS